MVITPKDFIFNCICGKEHVVTLKSAIIKSGALLDSDVILALRQQTGLTGRLTAVYDENTWKATEHMHPQSEQNIILSPNNLHANEIAVEQVLSELQSPEVLMAVGSGTIHDIVRFCAWKALVYRSLVCQRRLV